MALKEDTNQFGESENKNIKKCNKFKNSERFILQINKEVKNETKFGEA